MKQANEQASEIDISFCRPPTCGPQSHRLLWSRWIRPGHYYQHQTLPTTLAMFGALATLAGECPQWNDDSPRWLKSMQSLSPGYGPTVFRSEQSLSSTATP